MFMTNLCTERILVDTFFIPRVIKKRTEEMFIFRHVQYLLFGVPCLLARGPPPGGQRPDQRPPPDQRPSSSLVHSSTIIYSEQSPDLRPSPSLHHSKFTINSERTLNPRPSSNLDHSKSTINSEQSHIQRLSSSLEHSKITMTSEQPHNLRPSSSFELSKFAMNSEQSHNLRPLSSYKTSKSMTSSEYMNDAAMTSASIPSIPAHIHRPSHSSISMYSKVQSSRQLPTVIKTYSQSKCGSNLYMTDDSSTGIHVTSSMAHLFLTSMLLSTPSTDFHNYKSNSECSQDCQAQRHTTTIYSRLRTSGDPHVSYFTFRPSPTINRPLPVYGTETGQSPLTDSLSHSSTKIPFKSDIFSTRMMTSSIHETATQNNLTEIMTSSTALKLTPVNPSKEMTSRKQITDVTKSPVGLDVGHQDSKEMDNGKPVSTAGSFFTAGILVLVNRLV